MKPPFVLQVRLIGLGLFAVGLVLPPPATAAEDPLVGEWPGYTRAFEAPVAFHANYIYVGGLMHIFDVSIPFNPIRLGGIGSASGRDVVFAGNYAYLAAGGDGLKIYDVSNPLLPAPVATLDTPGSAQGIAVSGNHVYLADYEGGFRIFNVANPASPSLVGSLPVISLANDVVVSGNFAFVADELDGFRVVNISNPAAPVLVTTLSTKTGYSYRAVLSGNFVYLGGEDDDEDEDIYPSLHIIDITNPTAPVLAGTHNDMNGVYDIAVSGNILYLIGDGRFTGGIQAVDVSDPANPVITVAPPGVNNQDRVVLANGHLFTTDPGFGLRIFTASPVEIQPVGGFEISGYARDVAISGNYAYLADDHADLKIIDISNPAAPVRSGQLTLPGAVTGVAVSGSFAYLARSTFGFAVVNVSNPSNPTVPATLPMMNAHRVAVAGAFAYVADDSAGLRIVNIGNPASPVIAGTYNTPSIALGVAVSGTHAYVADWTAGVHIINVSNPASPTLVGTFNTPDAASDVAVSGNLLYVADGSSGLRILDISNPAAPVSVGALDTPGTANGIDLGSVFLATQSAGVRVINVTDPANPAETNSYQTLGLAENVRVSGAHVFAAVGARGLNIFNKEKLSGGTPTFTLAIDDPQIEEGNDGNSPITFMVALNAASTVPVSVDYTTANLTAVAGADYLPTAGTLTFLPGGPLALPIVVQVIGDVAAEADEIFRVVLSNSANAAIGKANGNATIVDDDPPATFTIDDITVTEDDFNSVALVFTITLSRPVAVLSSVKLTTADFTATAGTDYITVDTTVEFTPGTVTRQVPVFALADLLMEGDETFAANLSNPVYARIADAQGIGTILNNDHYPQFLPMDAGTNANILDMWGDSPENLWAVGAGGLILHFNGNPSNKWTVVQSGVTADLHTIHGSAANNIVVAGGPLLAPGGPLLRYDGNTWSALPALAYTVQDVCVTPGGVIYAVGANFVPGFDRPTASRLTAGAWSHMWFDPQPIRNFAAAIFPFADTNLFAGLRGSDSSLYHYDGNQIVSPDDLTGRWDQTQFVSPMGFLWLGGIINPAPPHQLLVIGQTPQNSTLGVFNYQNGALTALPVAADSPLIVYNASEAWGRSLSNLFLAGSSAQNIGQIGFYDGTKWTPATLPSAASLPRLNAIWGVGAKDVFAVGDAGTILRVHNPRVSVNSITLVEGNAGTSTATFTVTLWPSNQFQTVTVQYATRAGTATGGTDYLGTSGTLPFAPGETNKTIQVTVNSDTLKEGDETFFLDLTNPVNAALGFNQGLATIQNDDALPVLSVSNVSVIEGDGGGPVVAKFTVTLSEASTEHVRFSYRTVETGGQGGAIDDDPLTGESDYIRESGAVAMSPGMTSFDIEVSIRADTAFEPNEIFHLQLSNSENASLQGDGFGVGTILNDDLSNARPILDAIANQTVAEGAPLNVTAIVNDQDPADTHTFSVEGPPGMTINPQTGAITFIPGESQGPGTYTVTITATDSGTPAQSDTEIFDVIVTESNQSPVITAILDATLQPGSLFQYQVLVTDPDLPAQNITYSLENAPSGVTIDSSGRISWIPNPIDVGPHTFTVLASDGVATGTATATLTVANQPPVLDPIPNQVAAQGGELHILVTATDPNQAPGTLRYSLGPNAPSGVSIDEITGDLTWTIPTATQLGDHTITVIVTDPLGASDNQAVTVNVRPGLSIDNPRVIEGNAWGPPGADLQFTVTLSSPSDQTVTVDYRLINGTANGIGAVLLSVPDATSSGTDFFPDPTRPTKRITFAPGQTVQKFSVMILGDDAVESDETFTAQLINPQNAEIARETGNATIVDDDGPRPVISLPGNIVATEGHALSFRVTAAPGNASSGSSVNLSSILPDGFTREPNTGIVSGIPGPNDTYLEFVFTATDVMNGEITEARLSVPVNPPVQIRLNAPAISSQGIEIEIDGPPPLPDSNPYSLESTPQLDQTQPGFGFVPRSAIRSSAGHGSIFLGPSPNRQSFFRITNLRILFYSGNQFSLRGEIGAPDGVDVASRNPRFRVQFRPGEPFQEFPATVSSVPRHSADNRWTFSADIPLPTGIPDVHSIRYELVYDRASANTQILTALRSVTIQRSSTPIVVFPDVFVPPNQPFPFVPIPYPVYVSDPGGNPAALQIKVRTDNPSRIPNVTVGGQGANRTILPEVNPAVPGRATITIDVTSPTGGSASGTFNLQPQPPIIDFNGDGKPDLLGRLLDGTLNGLSLGNPTTFFAFSPTFPGGRRSIHIDLDGDGKPEIVTQDTDGALKARFMNGLATVSETPLNPGNFGPGLLILAGDFDADGKDDLLLQEQDRTHHVSFMNGVNRISTARLPVFREPDPAWHCVATADLNLDGHTDLVQQHNDGRFVVQYLRGVTTVALESFFQTASFNPDWRIVGVANINTDGFPEIVFQHARGLLGQLDGKTRAFSEIPWPNRPENPADVPRFGVSP